MISRQQQPLSEQRFHERQRRHAPSMAQWKESFRNACLDRARTKRRERLGARRARLLVEEELRQRGITIIGGSVITNDEEEVEELVDMEDRCQEGEDDLGSMVDLPCPSVVQVVDRGDGVLTPAGPGVSGSKAKDGEDDGPDKTAANTADTSLDGTHGGVC